MRLFILTFFLLTQSVLVAQTLTDSIKWIPLDSVAPRFARVQKPVMIYLYANKNDSCRVQERTTFSNPEVANYINILFYPVKFDVHSKETVKFFDENVYKNTSGNIHNLAQMLTGGIDSLPAVVIFSRRAKGQPFFGYQTRDEIFRPLIFFSENIDQWVDYSDWKTLHTKAFPPGQQQVMTRLIIRWKTLAEANELNKTAPRKTLLSFYNYNYIAETVMRTQVYNEKSVAEYLNKMYYPVNIDVFTRDTLSVKGFDYINENQSHKFHQLPIAALEGKMIFPAFIILDENGNVLDRVQKFLTPKDLLVILKYYGDNAYKTIPWETYSKENPTKN